MLQATRAEKEPEFTAAERRHLAALSPFIAHALTSAGSLEVPLVESEDSGLIIADPQGRVQHLSPQARRLLWMTTTPVMSPSVRLAARHDLVLPEGARQLCGRLAEIFRYDEHTVPPVWRHLNAWGGFTFRAYWLNQRRSTAAPEPAPLIGMTITRQEPLPVKLLRHRERLPLSNRQTQVCLLLAAGHSSKTIARRLDVSEHTIVTHCLQIYDKLEVHSRGELMNKLLSL